MKKENIKLNFIFNLISELFIVLCPLVVAPKISRVFGVDFIGLKSYTYSIVYYFGIVGVLGLDLLGQRKIAQYRNNIEKRNSIFTTIFVSRFILCSLVSFIYLGFIFVFSRNNLEKICFLCWGLYLIRLIINPAWFLQGLEKYKIYSIFNIFSHLLYTILTFLLINSKNDLFLYIILYCSCPLLTSLLLYIFVFKNAKFTKFSIKDLFSNVKESFVFFVPTIATALFSTIDKTMLGIFDPTQIWTGLYESAEKIIKVAISIVTASFSIMRVRMSFSIQNEEENIVIRNRKNFYSFSSMFCFPVMFGLIATSNDFIPLFFGTDFADSVIICQLLSIIVLPLAFNGIIQAIYFFPNGLQKKANLYTIIVAIVNILLNGVLIYLLGYTGAIISSVVSELLLSILLFSSSYKQLDYLSFLKISIKHFVASIFMFFAVLLFSKFLIVPIIFKLLIEVCSGILIYFILLIAFKDELLIKNLGKLFRNEKNK